MPLLGCLKLIDLKDPTPGFLHDLGDPAQPRVTFFPSFFRLLLLHRFSSKTGPKMVRKWSQNPPKIDPYHTTCPYIQKVCFWMTLLWKT